MLHVDIPEGHEYNIDGDLVPKGSVTPGNMYGDIDNCWTPKKAKEKEQKDPEWAAKVDAIMDAIDPLIKTTNEKQNAELMDEIDAFAATKKEN